MLSWRGAKRSALWRDIRARVITKASHTSAANNNTLAQVPTSPHGERVISFNNSSRKRSFQHIFPAAHAQNIDANRSVRRRHIVDRTSISAAEHCQSDSACDEGLSTCEPSFSNSAFDEGPSTCQPSSSNAEHRQSDSALDEDIFLLLLTALAHNFTITTTTAVSEDACLFSIIIDKAFHL
ncbi:hypothetical protein Tco_1462904 [Tanacetum coccineum]